jgi:phytoene dehydrogenase-like protein
MFIGIGGLCCAALLAYYGYRVTVCEAHYHAGGAAHGFDIAGYKFDAGPSFFAGISGGPETRSANPLKQLLDVLGESLDCATYNRVSAITGGYYAGYDFLHHEMNDEVS